MTAASFLTLDIASQFLGGNIPIDLSEFSIVDEYALTVSVSRQAGDVS